MPARATRSTLAPALGAAPSTATGLPSAGPLSPEHLRQLAEARTRARKITRAATIAAFSGWTLVVFSGLTLISALFGDLASLLVGLGLGVCAYHELRGGRMLRRFDPLGARRLGINQLALGSLIILYAAWSLIAARSNPALAAAAQTGDPDVDAMVRQMTTMVTFGLYGGMMVAGFVVPGLTALYYFSRAALVRRLISGTPAWVIDAMRIAA